ncbi:GH116 family glycosyl hydrolase [Rufibacter roseus]|uniref:GH116 family glycosyl hydrolase n=1 Tax=Rufibacter roseus TaxID=1567108 RepID=A0ABW2DI12_9BACT|nr:GH116 family glycosyl hydrolase [Rufibacter roseus]
MKKNNNRRSFLKQVGIGGIGATILPTTLLANPGLGQSETNNKAAQTKEAGKEKERNGRKYNTPYTGENLRRVAFPIGGIGAGMFCLEGGGAISHMSVHNKPNMFHEPTMFGAITIKGEKNVARVIEGPVPEWKLFGQPNNANGSGGAIYGLPRFNQVEFVAQFPFGIINLADEAVPVKVQLTGWSPFIPTDEDNSSLPVGALEYKFTNQSKEAIEAVFSYNARNFVVQDPKASVKKTSPLGMIKKMKNGFLLAQNGTKKQPHLQSNFAIYTDEASTVVDHTWFRGGWWDPLSMAWNNIKEGNVKAVEPVESGAPGASLYVPFRLKPGEEKTVKVMMAWYMPNSDVRFGKIGEESEATASNCITPDQKDLENTKSYDSKTYKPWYSSKFKNVDEVVNYWLSNYQDLRQKSGLFRDAFYSSTLPPEVIEAVAANLTIIKSPTVLRQYDGRLWNWEGCTDVKGCCAGSCTHVWNYAQAIPHLFPSLERSLRHTEFCENQNADGHQGFRANLPITPLVHDFHAAADGQLGTIMKVHREWRISGDTTWLKKMYPMVKTSLDWCIDTWDPRRAGIIEEPHHNTYDIEFWGPNGMITSFYLGALQAMVEMGKALKQDVSEYKKLYAQGKKYIETELYDGEYFIQKIKWTGLKAPDPVKASEISIGGGYSEEALALLQQEGPKYQYGTGCLSDGILGGWIARMCALEEPVDPHKTQSHLLAVHKYNLKKDLTEHANPQRPTYAAGNEGGLLICTWPKGGKLSLPFVYSDEVWTGIEYQVASHLMLHGQVDKGLEIVRTCRDRYDGKVRNPFNEYECGHWYGRAQASYGFLESLTGVRFDAVDGTLHIDSKVGDFTSFISTEKGFGTVTLKGGKPSLQVAYGSIPVKKVLVSGKKAKLS